MANNQGDGSRVPVDLTRWEHEEQDISGKFNARAGDTQDFIPMWVKDNGFPVDVRNWSVVYGGADSLGVGHRHTIERIGDLPLKRGDQPRVGKFTLLFDERTFNVPGKWEQFFVQFINEEGETVPTSKNSISTWTWSPRPPMMSRPKSNRPARTSRTT